MANKSYYNELIRVLQALKKEHPTYGMGRHLATALADYGDSWGITDKEFLFALEKYREELEYTTPDKELEKIIEDGKNLESLFKRDPFNLDELEEEEEY